MMINFEWASAVVFLLLLTIFVILKRKSFKFQHIIKIGKLPLVYIVMMRTQVGIKLMEKWGAKYREIIKFLGYCGVGFGFFGLIFIFFSLFQNIYIIFTQPQAVAGVQLALPGLSLPGVGVLTFWYWIISIFVLAVVHEFSHGVVSAAHNLKVKNSGPAIFGVIIPFIPAAYVEPDEKDMLKREDIVQYSIYAAGPMSNVVLGILLFIFLAVLFVPIEKSNSEEIGFSFIANDEKYPAYEFFRERTVLNKVNGEEMSNAQEFIDYMQYVKPGDNLVFANDEKEYKIIATENPSNPKKGFIGVVDIKNERKWYSDMFENIFVWFRDLFKWMALLNIFIGIANLLPIGPVDGGQMLRTLLLKVFKDEKKAMKWFGFISLLTVVLILAGLLLPMTV